MAWPSGDDQGRKRAAPVRRRLLLSPGVLWSCSSSSSSRSSRCSGCRCRRGRAASPTRRSPGTGRTTPTRSRSTATSSSARSCTRSIATVLALADRLPARVRHRVPRRALQEPAARARRHPVLHHLPDPHDRVEDDPRRRGCGRRRCSATSGSSGRPGTLLRTPLAVIGGLTYNFLPFMVLPIYVEPREDRPRPRRRGATTSTRRPGARSARSCSRCRCPGCSPAACSCSSRPRATSSTPSTSAARRRR